MIQWHKLLRYCMMNGKIRSNAPGMPTHALFNAHIDVNVGALAFPAVTSKQLHFKQVAAELAAFLHGETTLEGFHKWGCKIWDANAANSPHEAKEVGRVYGAQWRAWQAEDGSSIDQLRKLVTGLASDPQGRRHILQAYNPGATDACLPACHMSAQFISDGGLLHCIVTMRSCDLFLGLPFDIASYALLMRLICKYAGKLIPGTLSFNIGDAHIYQNHQDQVHAVLGNPIYLEPLLLLDNEANLFEFQPLDAVLTNYKHAGNIPAPMNIHKE